MDKIKAALAVSVIACIVLASSFVVVVLNFQNMIQQQSKEIEELNVKISDLDGENDFFRRIILEFIDMGKLANDSIEEAFFRSLP